MLPIAPPAPADRPQLTVRNFDRERHAELQRRQAGLRRLVDVPKCQHRRRREYLEQLPQRWLRWYLAHIFTRPFTEQQQVMIDALVAAIQYGGDQALAASRGEGKTTNCECVLLWAILTGKAHFAVLFSATGTDAEESLSTWRELFTDGRAHRLQADYPEVCTPLLALEDTPQRAHGMQVRGFRHDNGEAYGPVGCKFTWSGRKVTLPRVPGSPSRGAIFATRGLDAAVRGLKVGQLRPDVAVIDDPDTEETVNNPEQAKKLVRKIDRTIAGLAPQDRSMARVMLTTLQKAECVSAWYTDPKEKPTWKGRRFRFMVRPPERQDLWEEYVQLRQTAMELFATGEGDDEHAREAHRFYLENRDEMDRGAQVANAWRFNGITLDDGSQAEVSAIQHYYNQVARIGPEAVATEYDNSPPPEAAPQESGITAYRVQTQVSGYARRVVPPGCALITAAIDVRKIALHWVARAWEVNGTGYQVDYGVHEVRGTVLGSDEGVDLAIRRAILEKMDDWRSNPYCTEDGAPVPIRLVLVDAGWRTEAVYLACLNWGLGIAPAMGFGKSAGCAKPNFSDAQTSSKSRRAGDGWFYSRRTHDGRGLWLACLDADRWKAWEHDRWMTDPGRVGAVTNWGSIFDPQNRTHRKRHFAFSKHITAEVEVEEIVDGMLKRYWLAKSDNNHWLDASYMADAAANICGVKLTRPTRPQHPQPRPAAAHAPAAATTTEDQPPAEGLRPGRVSGGPRPGASGRNRW